MKKAALLFFLFLFMPFTGFAEEIQWQELAPSLDYTLMEEVEERENNKEILGNTLNWRIHVVRINSEKYEFDLLGKNFEQAGEQKSRSLAEWAKEYDLFAAINASMYMPDGYTSNGYMVKNKEVNFNRIVNRLGGFFVADPKKSKIPYARIIEKAENNWESQLKNYNIVVQNFRIIGTQSGKKEPQVIWKESQELFSTIAAIGEDKENNIYFFLSQNPATVNEFGNYLIRKKEKGIALTKLLYVEGGSHASLYINSKKTKSVNTGFDWFYLYYLQNAVSVPNIIGVKEKKE